MTRQDDVLMVGGGVIGLAAALALLDAGRGVRVIDAGRTGHGASHGNCGTITPSHSPPLAAPGVIARALRWMLTPDAPLYIAPRLDPALWGWLWRFARRCDMGHWHASAQAKAALLNDSRARFPDWVAGHELACEFAQSGHDYVYRDPRAFAQGRADQALLAQLGVVSQAIDGPAYEAQEPAVNPGVAGAIRFAGDAVLRPDRYVDELARAVRARGGEIVEDCALQSLAADAGGVTVHTTRGPLRAGQVVLALGAWSPRMADAVGLPVLKRAMQPGKGYSMTYSPPALVPRHPLVLRERSVCVTAWDSGFRLGSTMEFSGFDDSLNERRLGALERAAREYLREPVGPELRERWSGWRPMSCDDIPIIGRARDRVWVSTGHGMMGVGMSVGSAQLLADLVTGRDTAIDPVPYRIARFG